MFNETAKKLNTSASRVVFVLDAAMHELQVQDDSASALSASGQQNPSHLNHAYESNPGATAGDDNQQNENGGIGVIGAQMSR